MNQWDDQEWFDSIYHSTQRQLSLALLRIVKYHPLLKDSFDEILDSVYMRLSQNSQPNSDTPDMNSRKER